MIKENIKEIVRLAESGETWWCATIGDSNANWCQFTWDSLNFKFPFSVDPLQLLSNKGIQLAPFMEISAFKMNAFLTLSHGGYEFDELTVFIIEYFEKILGTKETNLSVKTEKL